MRVCVIGGGPSGLVTLKYLVNAHRSLDTDPVEVRLFEVEGRVGGTFATRTYEEAELVSSRQLTTFSDFRHPGPEDFLSTEEYVQYLEDYCTRFSLWPHITLNAKVASIERGRGGGHVVKYAINGGEEETYVCDALAVCSGLHVEPNIPQIEGIEHVPEVFHSSDFKSRSQFGVDKTVLVVGSGETGADLAYLAITSPTQHVLISHRDGVHFAAKRNGGPVLLPILGRKPDPKEPGIPIDISKACLFDTSYLHPVLRDSFLLWDYYHWYIKTFLWIAAGSTAGMDQWAGEISKERHHPSRIFFNKSRKVCPYISAPYRPTAPGWDLWLYALRSAIVQAPIPDTDGRQVDLAPWPERFDSSGVVHFRDNGRPEYHRMQHKKIRPDIVVLCTGYTQTFPFFKRGGSGREYPVQEEADVRDIWKRDDPSVAFIGFVRPSLGAIPPLAEMQAQLWVVNLLAPQRLPAPLLPKDEGHYRLIAPPGARIKYGVDHESYAYQLALDLGSAPGFIDIMKLAVWEGSWRLPIIWAFGAQLNTKFRLGGPWQWEGASDLLASSEFWETITRRPMFFGHFAVSIFPMLIFGPLSLAVFLYVTIADLVRGPRTMPIKKKLTVAI